ncbi:vacuolar atpase assembly integral membrane protein vma21 [Pseudohyphozyma bogoriensis]|nr:vacuolar atpase assembly integral membrane protein vma21 [Pseudohyphozyma bogoriensis]
MKKAEPANRGPEQDLSIVLLKLALFTLAMVVLPIGTYYGSRDYYFHDNTTGAGILAAIVANLILIGFVVMAFMDDKEYPEEGAASGDKKGSTAVAPKKTTAVAPKETKKDL